jgi:hypothetical protein
VRWAQRALGTYVGTLVVYLVVTNFLLLVIALIILVTKGWLPHLVAPIDKTPGRDEA